ncbi:MAG TPA: hypothetical protein VFT28_04300 [Gemmatimonadales bacterium]|nr:hypothetical protein [Gemmatimonadales bacterium]
MSDFGSALRRLVVPTLGAASLATGPAQAQRAARAEDFLGVTRCDSGQVVSEIREDVRRSDLRAEVEAHEAVHRQQAAAYGGCEAFLASLTTARRIIESELPAYCAQWKVAVARGADSVATRLDYAWRISAQSGAMENRLDIARRFRDECG